MTRGAVTAAVMLVALRAFAALPASTMLGPKPKPAADVRRVITLAPSLTDVVLALGAKDTLVGVTRFDEQPEVAKLPRVGGFSDPSVETILSLKPDLLIVQAGPGNRAAVETLASSGVPVAMFPLENVDGVVECLHTLGELLGHQAEGAKLTKALQDARAKVRAAAAKLPRPRVMFAYGFDPLVVAGPGSFADELLTDAGGVNVVKRPANAYATWSAEAAIASSPEIIVDAADPDVGMDKLRAMEGLSRARWVKVPTRELLYPGPRLERGLWDLFRLLHPDAVSPPR